MLNNIHVKNIALIKEIDINFENGLNILTGETGAGKSLIIGSVALGLGAKIPKDYIFLGEEEALIELTFTEVSEDVKKILEENGILSEDNTVIFQRRVTRTRTVNRINFTTVSLAFLREVGSKLMQIHGQHDNQILLNKDTHIDILDSYAGNDLGKLLDNYKIKFSKLINIHSEIKRLGKLEESRSRDIDYYKFVIEEIDDINPIIGEDDELKNKYNMMVDLQNSHDTAEYVTDQIGNIALVAVSSAVSSFSKIKEINDNSKNVYKALLEAEDVIKNVSKETDSFLDSIDFDEEEFDILDNRVDQLDTLKKKYGGSLEKVMLYKEEITEKLEELISMDQRLVDLKKERIMLAKDIGELADKITEIRKKYAYEMQNKIKTLLEELNFLQVKFEFRFSKSNKLQSNGQDEVEMFISTNVGHDLRPLGEVSSGGELSRIMLAIQSIISDVYSVGSIIFDEIDAGISGKTGIMVAKRLKEMAKSLQIVCITHLPQIAGVGDVHYKIEKMVEQGSTNTKLTKLDEEESIKEVARLLGGLDITEATLQNAKELRSSLK